MACSNSVVNFYGWNYGSDIDVHVHVVSERGSDENNAFCGSSE
jgi:hypothetical protein